jgi:hypothetical protein
MNKNKSLIIYKAILICLFLTCNASYAFDFGNIADGFKIKVNGEEVTTSSSQNPNTQQGDLPFSDISATPANRDTINIAFLKLSSNIDIDSHKDKLFQYFYKNEYQSYRSNEFQYEKRKNAAIKNLHDRIEQLDTENFYSVVYTEIGNYDFESNAFPVEVKSFYVDGRMGIDNSPSRHVMHISNDEFIEDLSMPADEAEKFLINRTPKAMVKSSNFNRKVVMLVKYRIDKVEINKEKSYIADYYVTVKSYKIFDGQKDATLTGLIASKP